MSDSHAYVILIGPTPDGHFGVWAPYPPGCIALGDTVQDTEREMRAEHAMAFTVQALHRLEREPYGTAHGRIPALRRALEGSQRALVLDEWARSLPAVYYPWFAWCSWIRLGSSASRNRHRLLTVSSSMI
ncbi:MAG: type II toxin-antitoxin system HicB family antitoxin [Pseudonocardiaceae bacterium]